MRHQLKRRLIVLLSAVVVLVGASAGSAVGGEDGVLFGAYSGPRTGESEQAAVLRMERDVGRELDVVREFVQWDERFDSYLTWLQQSERTVILSVKSNRLNGTVIPWADIANAQPGSTLHNEMVAWADRMKAWAKPVYFAFNHEPEAGINRSKGTATDYINAFRALRQVFRDRGVTNTKFIWIMTDYAFFVGPQDRRDAAKWYPGDAYVDAMGADAYNWFTCRTGIDTAWWTLERIIEPFRDFGAAHPDKELWLTEFGSAEDPANPARKAEWFAQAQALFKRADYSQFVGVSYFDRFGGDQCYWQPSSSPASLAAFRAMGQDSFYGGPVTPPPDPDPEPATYPAPPPVTIDPSVDYSATLETSCGTIVIALDADAAPIAVNNFVFLAREGFYDGLRFHRVVTGFVIQGGDPEGDGRGGPGYTFPDELPDDGYPAGSVAMVNSGPDTNGSQFFIVTGAAELPNVYSRFGTVTRGLDVARAIEAFADPNADPGDPSSQTPSEPVYVYSVTITES